MRISAFLRPVVLGSAALMLAAMPLHAQTRDDNRAACLSSDSDVSIAGCTADINSGDETTPSDLALAYYNRGLSYAHKHDFQSAIADYNKAIELNADDSNFHDGLGEAYYNTGQRDAAIDEFNTALKINPNDDVAQSDLDDMAE